MSHSPEHSVLNELRKRIYALQGITKSGGEHYKMGLGAIEKAFPQGIFPVGAMHEFVSQTPESASAASGFLTCILNAMTVRKGFSLWISSRHLVFPPAMKLLGIDPECVIFIDLKNDKEVLWAVEEALRCSVLIAVVGEIKELTFAQSRRLQLATEESKVTGFIHRVYPKVINATTCVARWEIHPLPGIIEQGMPGIGFPKWNIELTKVRSGRPGSWELGWTPDGFKHFDKASDNTDFESEVSYA